MMNSFACECGRVLRARVELAGKKARCPQCSAVLVIPGTPLDSAPTKPRPETDPDDLDPGDEYQPDGINPILPPADGPASRPRPVDPELAPTTFAAAPRQASRPEPKREEAGRSSLLEYSHLLLVFALIPLVISLLGKKEETNLPERLARSIASASPEDQQRIENVLSRDDTTLDQAMALLPGGKLDGAHLAHDSSVHWLYAAIAATGFLLLLGLFFSVERAQPLHLLGIGAFTGTVGIIFLFLVQICSNLRIHRFPGPILIKLLLLVLTLIGWSYDSANDPNSNFFLSALGFTLGVGLCEEFTKAIPLFFNFRRDSRMGWRGACLWGLASGIGFGVSEGIMYSSRYYNGVSGVDIYLVRFVSCVALHAMWSASVGIAIARNVDEYEDIHDLSGFGLFLLRVMAVPMTLHGFYDTLLKKDMNVGALVVALLSFAWFAWHIELARGAEPDAGRPRSARRRAAY